MTAKQLIRALERVVKDHGNVPVAVDWPALRDASNGVYEIARVGSVEVEVIAQADGDGFTISNKDGSERTKRTAVMR